MGEAKSTAELTIEDIQNQLNEEERFQLLSTNQPPKFIKGLRSCEARINEDFRFTVQGIFTFAFFLINRLNKYTIAFLLADFLCADLNRINVVIFFFFFLSKYCTGTESLLVQRRRISGGIRQISRGERESWHMPSRSAKTRIYRSSEYSRNT